LFVQQNAQIDRYTDTQIHRYTDTLITISGPKRLVHRFTITNTHTHTSTHTHTHTHTHSDYQNSRAPID
jgi:hypothetical protein